MGKIDRIERQTRNRFLNLYEFKVTRRDGSSGSYYVASRAEEEKDLKAVSHRNHPDGVIMYALTEDKSKVLLVRQYRYPLGGYVYELPAGLCDPGESYREAAVREIHEETGMTLRTLDVDPVYETPRFSSIGMTDESCAIVFGYVSGELSQDFMEATEEIEPILVDRAEARRILREENVAAPCSYHIERFVTDEDPFAYLFKL